VKPLEGTRVLDLSRLLPGPFASLVLADMGATVDKVEDPSGGDYLRHMPPIVDGMSGMFKALNRGKRSACLDLKKPEATRAFLRMVERYDVVLEQFRPGVLDRLGVGHATLRAKNPRLIVCALTGYGQDGPLALRAGHDLNYLARAGVLGFQGPAGGPPQVPGVQLADVSGGLWCIIGILAALHEREKTGKGSIVDIAMIESALGFAAAGWGSLFGGAEHARGEGSLTGGLALYGTYETKDAKYMSLGALEPKFWLAFCAGVGLEGKGTDLVPGPHQNELRAKLAGIFKTKTRAEWETFGRERDCCLEPVLSPEEAMRDPHLVARDMFFEQDGMKHFRTPLTPRHTTFAPPPPQGAHTDAILRECGFTAAEIAELRASGAAA
jgi:crotonobetainyl-CoA:carnitine CoA-transferase CaiB-like acyl-CoA transferase